MTAAARRARFESLFNGSYEQLLAYARRRVGVEAEDVVAEVMLTAWRRLDDVPPEEIAWLYGVARHMIRVSQRSARRRVALANRLFSQPGAHGDLGGRATDSPLVMRALAQLSERDREPILLVAWEGLDGP